MCVVAFIPAFKIKLTTTVVFTPTPCISNNKKKAKREMMRTHQMRD
jgi:hypothetical protein